MSKKNRNAPSPLRVANTPQNPWLKAAAWYANPHAASAKAGLRDPIRTASAGPSLAIRLPHHARRGHLPRPRKRRHHLPAARPRRRPRARRQHRRAALSPSCHLFPLGPAHRLLDAPPHLALACGRCFRHRLGRRIPSAPACVPVGSGSPVFERLFRRFCRRCLRRHHGHAQERVEPSSRQQLLPDWLARFRRRRCLCARHILRSTPAQFPRLDRRRHDRLALARCTGHAIPARHQRAKPETHRRAHLARVQVHFPSLGSYSVHAPRRLPHAAAAP